MGKAPLHVAAHTGNLDTLIKLLEAGAHRAPRDRVKFPDLLFVHCLTVCTVVS